MSTNLALMATDSAVVLNDKKVTARAGVQANKQAVDNAPATNLAGIEAKRKNWETTAYRTSNQQLYSVLADCLSYGEALPVADAKRRTKELNEFIQARGYTVKNDCPLLTRIIKAVFGNVDRRRISTYSLVLRSAVKEGVTADKLAGWIEERGGVQEIRLSRSDSYLSPKTKAEKAKSKFSAMPNLAVAKERLSEFSDAEFVGCECVLLAEQQSDGSFHIKALTRSGAAVNAALMALYSAQQKAAA